MFNYVAYYIRILLEYHKDYSKLNRKIEKDFFYGIKKAFQELDKNENLESIKYEIKKSIKINYKIIIAIFNIIKSII